VLFHGLVPHEPRELFFPREDPGPRARREGRQAQGPTHPDTGQDRQTQTDRRAETQETPQTTDSFFSPFSHSSDCTFFFPTQIVKWIHSQMPDAT
jgi:hypothetical protein